MKLIHLVGNTYYINDSTVIGVYIFPDQTCLLIDSPAKSNSAACVMDLLYQKGLTVHAILNTHCHSDHCGGNHYIQEQSNCKIYATYSEAILIENTILQANILYGSSPPKILRNHFIMPQPSKVTNVISPGNLTIKNKNFSVLDLGGHTTEHCGYCTPDGVTFVGDSLIDPKIIENYPFIYLSDLKKHFKTLEFFKKFNKPVVLAHGGLQNDLSFCLNKNQEIIGEIIADYLALLKTNALSREEIIRTTMFQRDINQNTIQYYFTLATVSAYLAYLYDEKQISCFMKDGIMKFAATMRKI